MRKFLITLAHKLPNIQQIASVYAIIVIPLYTWTIYWWMWKLSSWLYFLPALDILSILAYALVMDFFESLIILLVLLVFCILLPRKLFGDAFVARGSTVVILFLGFLMVFSFSFKSIDPKDYPLALAEIAPFILGAILPIAYLVPRLHAVNRVVESFAERAKIFLYLSVPASIVSLIIVIIRNLVVGSRRG